MSYLHRGIHIGDTIRGRIGRSSTAEVTVQALLAPADTTHKTFECIWADGKTVEEQPNNWGELFKTIKQDSEPLPRPWFSLPIYLISASVLLSTGLLAKRFLF